VGPAHRGLAVTAQEADKASTLAYARAFLAARKTLAVLRTGEMKFVPAPTPILAFSRNLDGERLLCVFNLSRGPVTFGLGAFGPVQALDLGCGEAKVAAGSLELGPLACWFGRL
jgi:alpha-glucosidase